VTFYVGIDPGKVGSMVVIDDHNHVAVFPFKKGMVDTIKFLRENAAQCIAAVEDVHAYQGGGSSSSFAFGRNTGYLHGMLDMAGIRYIKVQPRLWQSVVTVTPVKVKAPVGASAHTKLKCRKENKDNLKAESIRSANEHLPRLQTKDHNVADAANLAVYLRYIHKLPQI
jgi:hypothetical protein